MAKRIRTEEEFSEGVGKILAAAGVVDNPSLGMLLRNPKALEEIRRAKQLIEGLEAQSGSNRGAFMGTKAELIGRFSTRQFIHRVDISVFQTSMTDSTGNIAETAMPQRTRDELISDNIAARQAILGAFGKLGRMSEAAGWIIPIGQEEARRISAAYDHALQGEGAKAVDRELSAIFKGIKDGVLKPVLGKTAGKYAGLEGKLEMILNEDHSARRA